MENLQTSLLKKVGKKFNKRPHDKSETSEEIDNQMGKIFKTFKDDISDEEYTKRTGKKKKRIQMELALSFLKQIDDQDTEKSSFLRHYMAKMVEKIYEEEEEFENKD